MENKESIKQELVAAKRNIKCSEATIEDLKKQIHSEEHAIIHLKGWITALTWTLDEKH